MKELSVGQRVITKVADSVPEEYWSKAGNIIAASNMRLMHFDTKWRYDIRFDDGTKGMNFTADQLQKL